ncbi:hypothetical protein I7I50_12627 [Histoplasma capsulatum G186AR]|uniref:Uncharacterized protein n=1 Tax=Ajellomyces capsulatus TaxID=5037 RepID=A0A8H7YCC0_AJECA|nr:hypothetical protein I7I52_11069 [Histoplasma capsulatum]QSS70857.1 hypothetical protein I7I50_12627 [Histoplasma capsulatum G186AR]
MAVIQFSNILCKYEYSWSVPTARSRGQDIFEIRGREMKSPDLIQLRNSIAMACPMSITPSARNIIGNV